MVIFAYWPYLSIFVNPATNMWCCTGLLSSVFARVHSHPGGAGFQHGKLWQCPSATARDQPPEWGPGQWQQEEMQAFPWEGRRGHCEFEILERSLLHYLSPGHSNSASCNILKPSPAVPSFCWKMTGLRCINHIQTLLEMLSGKGEHA